ncbi:BSD domain-containing protein 1 [Boleophthalmus pectinirostris]|uniref:BSD domain-containing protein 1 n=1 Tax=Boleophthalmus pectinirostris TaxID=150288 RepID=UPI00242B025C|nr:BSD domain-containing protein 1 [Boleophthalmus pectinirostris]
MADGESWWGGWFQQSFQAVKEKSSEALEFIKRDLTEFSTVVQHDTACSIVATATAVKNKLAVEGSSETTEKVKKSLSSFLGVITDTLAPPPDKTIDCDVITLVATPAGTTEVYDSSKARLYSLQADPATYCNEPDGPPEQFDSWMCSFSLEKKGEISELLVNSPSIRALYTKMVPAAVSHSEFWQRYFYKVFQLDQEEARRVALKQRAEQSTHTETLGWEEEEEDDFLCATPSSYQPALTPTMDQSSSTLTESSLLTPVQSPSEERLSLSSDSVSLPTQIDVQPELFVSELDKKMTEVSLDEITNTDDQPSPESAVTQPEANTEAVTGPPVKTEVTKEDGPQDLRVFELNSDSGKSTPSNNGKKGSSTDVSEDWEKDFDLDMTEEEVQMALSKIEASGEQLDEDWENWD